MKIDIEYSGGQGFGIMDGPYRVCHCFTPSEAHAAYIVNAVNTNAMLVEALELAKLGIEAMIEEDRCGETFLASALSLDKINAALAAAKRGSNE